MSRTRGAFAVEFGARARGIREARLLTQERLGEHAGLHATQVGHIERGERDVRLSTILKLARALEVDVAELVSGLPVPD